MMPMDNGAGGAGAILAVLVIVILVSTANIAMGAIESACWERRGDTWRYHKIGIWFCVEVRATSTNPHQSSGSGQGESLFSD